MSGYYGWKRKQLQRVGFDHDAVLVAHIKALHVHSHGAYGSPRIHQDLRYNVVRVSRKRVARIMQEHGLRGRSRRRMVHTMRPDKNALIAPNVLARVFTASQPNTKWVTDITYLPTGDGWLYLAAIIDLYSRRVIGYALADHLRTKLALEALDHAVRQRRPGVGLLHHSDQGCQYTSFCYQQRLTDYGMVCSMNRRGQCWDNSVAESFFGRLKEELLPRHQWATKAQAAEQVQAYIDKFYNAATIRKGLGYVCPVEYELNNRHMQSAV